MNTPSTILSHTKISCFNKISDGKKMLELTSISYGTLLCCAKEAECFGTSDFLQNNIRIDNGREILEIDCLRLAWQLFTFSTITGNYKNWVESWNAFVAYTKENAAESIIKTLITDHGCVLSEDQLTLVGHKGTYKVLPNNIVELNGEVVGCATVLLILDDF